MPDLRIVQAMLAFREGGMLRTVLDNHLSLADEVVVMLDNHDEETERAAKEYSDRIHLRYSTFPRAETDLNRRFKENEGKIRDELLSHVHALAAERPIDIVLWADADELFADSFLPQLDRFWRGRKSALLCSHIQMIDDFHHFHDRRFYMHCKAFRYRPDLSAVPLVAQGILNPYRKYRDTARSSRSIVHMADFSRDYMGRRAQYKRRPFGREVGVWYSRKDIRRLSPDEYNELVSRPPKCSMREYLSSRN